jgi:hypothetical protein
MPSAPKEGTPPAGKEPDEKQCPTEHFEYPGDTAQGKQLRLTGRSRGRKGKQLHGAVSHEQKRRDYP